MLVHTVLKAVVKKQLERRIAMGKDRKMGRQNVLLLMDIELFFSIVASLGLMFWICAGNSIENIQ